MLLSGRVTGLLQPDSACELARLGVGQIEASKRRTKDYVQASTLAAATQHDLVAVAKELFHAISFELAKPTSTNALVVWSNHRQAEFFSLNESCFKVSIRSRTAALAG